MSSQNRLFIQKTYDLANQAVLNGNHPFGALAVLGELVVATACNLVVSHKDSTKHAELNLASYLSQNFPQSTIEQMTIYSSTEPCSMCAGALYWVGCRHIVFGCSVHALGRHTTNSFGVELRDSLSSVSSKMKIEGPVSERAGEDIHMNFWKQFGGKK